MKVIKFELIKSGEWPIVRCTYLPWYYFITGTEIVRDVYKHKTETLGYWRYMDNSDLILQSEGSAINSFFDSGEKEYYVNHK
jgi:hypothetical protein